MSELLHIENLSVSYGKVEAVHRVEMTIAAGEIVAVLGANGAGKTTLLSAIGGLLPWSGEMRWKGSAVRHTAVEDMLAMGIALVPESRELFGGLSVQDNLRLGAFSELMAGKAEDRARLAWVYELFPRLSERCDQLASTLSGGERQMLALGRALMGRPQLLLLDEPSLGLAPLIVKEVLAIVSTLRETGVSILLVEQNAKAALSIADRGHVLELGNVVMSGEAASLRKDPRIAAAYLGTSPAVAH